MVFILYSVFRVHVVVDFFIFFSSEVGVGAINCKGPTVFVRPQQIIPPDEMVFILCSVFRVHIVVDFFIFFYSEKGGKKGRKRSWSRSGQCSQCSSLEFCTFCPRSVDEGSALQVSVWWGLSTFGLGLPTPKEQLAFWLKQSWVQILHVIRLIYIFIYFHFPFLVISDVPTSIFGRLWCSDLKSA